MAAATGLKRHVRQLLLLSGAHPSRGGEETATDRERQLRRQLGSLDGAFTSGVGEEAVMDQERQLCLLVGIGGAAACPDSHSGAR